MYIKINIVTVLTGLICFLVGMILGGMLVSAPGDGGGYTVILAIAAASTIAFAIYFVQSQEKQKELDEE